ncbi:polysaccharide biosynthesis C-terminal domain-containing protein [Arthrobacter sp. zg-ZUI10]|nr:polysaccharide biosynthesis C-terminal domain-containing protein [Arthrobacter sunyaminii]
MGFGTQGLYFLFLARALEVYEFGIWAGALALVSVFSGLVGLGGGNVLVVRVARSRNILHVQLGAALVYIFVSAIPLGLIAWFIGSSTSNIFARVLLLLLLSELIAVRVFDVALQVFQARDDLSRNSLCRIMGSTVRLVAVTVFFISGGNSVVVWSYWYALSTLVTAVIALAWSCKRYGSPRWNFQTLKDTWPTGIFFAIGISSRTLYLEADKFILNKYGLADAAGSFSAAGRIITMAFAPIQAIVYSSNTHFFRAGEKGAVELWRSMKRPLMFTVIYGILAAALLCLVAPLAPLALGASYSDVSTFLVWLSPLILLNGLHYLFGDALMGIGRQGARSIAQLTIAILSVAANVLLVPTYGAAASAVIAISCALVLAVLMIGLFCRAYLSDPTLSSSIAQ